MQTTMLSSTASGARASLKATPSPVQRAALAAPLRPRAGRHACSAACGCSKRLSVVAMGVNRKSKTPRSPKDDAEIRYLNKRSNDITKHFPTALGADDFINRVEVALYQYGFQNDNSIACINLCRDEVTHALKHKIDQVFGSSFSINGLGGVLTCGVTGVGAGLSHSPLDETSGKERYVFFSMPHIAIDSAGVVGNISRPGRANMSCACGALIKSLSEIKRDGLVCSCKQPGVHDPLDPEYSILKQRLARRLEFEGETDASLQTLDLVKLTQVAERTISSDLDFLISKAVDVNKADYAVITGIQIHNWSTQFDNDEPNLEFVAPIQAYCVVDGVKTNIDLTALPALTPRQIRLLAAAPDAHYPDLASAAEAVCNTAGNTTLREIDPPYMFSSKAARKQAKERLQAYKQISGETWSAADDKLLSQVSEAAKAK